MAALLYDTLKSDEHVLKEKVLHILSKEFPDDQDEMSDAIDKVNRHNYDYRHSFVPILIDENKNVCSCAIIVKHKSVWEVIWFASNKEKRSNKFGSRLFEHIHSNAKLASVDSIVVSSTSKALSWWLTRPELPIFRVCFELVYNHASCTCFFYILQFIFFSLLSIFLLT